MGGGGLEPVEKRRIIQTVLFTGIDDDLQADGTFQFTIDFFFALDSRLHLSHLHFIAVTPVLHIILQISGQL